MTRSATAWLVVTALSATITPLLTACGGAGAAADLGAVDAAIPDLSRGPDLWKGVPPDLAGAAGAIACANGASCAGGQVCCSEPADGGNTAYGACVATMDCPSMSKLSEACDGPEDCSGGTPVCCLDLALTDTPTGGSFCRAACPASAVQKMGMTPATLTSPLCHWDGDCAGLKGGLLGVELPFAHCCHHKVLPYIHFCAPDPSLASGAYDCP